jgi:predicted aminopeptidase
MRILTRNTARRRVALAAGLCSCLAALFLAFFPGCQAEYLRRQAVGAIRILRGRVAIDRKLEERLPLREREGLRWVARVREFASRELGLEPGDSYTTYYDTGGAPISTMVCATHPLALEPYRWCFPITGCVPYLGYFEPERAEEEKDRLRQEGWDAIVLPVDAFSTLGWFSDPVLSTTLSKTKGEIADLLIHELTHRTIYFKNDTRFNESLAEVVAHEGTVRLLAREFGEDSRELAEYRERLEGDEVRDAIMDRLWSDLDALYRSGLPVESKLKRKAELFATADVALKEAGAQGTLIASNATLMLSRQYTGLAPLLREAQDALGGHPRDLVASLKTLRGATSPAAALAARVMAISAATAPPAAPLR